jgi:hypothetical protein
MSRILDLIAKYDENLTIAQLKKAIESDKRIADQKEIDDLNQIKEEFANTYLKFLDEERMFGKTLNIYHIKEIVRTERCSDWSLVYYAKGSKISFSEREAYSRAFKPNTTHDSFSKEELREMTKITEQEYDEYVHQYSTIKTMLTDIVG